MFLAIQCGDCGLSLFIAAHFHEPEPFAAAGFAILDDLGALNSAVLSAQLFQIGVRYVVAEIPDVQFPAHYDAPMRLGPKPVFYFPGHSPKEADVPAQKEVSEEASADMKRFTKPIDSFADLPTTLVTGLPIDVQRNLRRFRINSYNQNTRHVQPQCNGHRNGRWICSSD